MGPTCSGFLEKIGQGITVLMFPRYSTTDHWIQESIEQIINYGLFWVVGDAEKKKSKLL